MTIEVHRADGAQYEVHDRWMVVGGEPIAVGSELRVFVDATNPDKVAIDWDETRRVARKKAEERRRFLSVGVPVAASKVRRDAEESGYVQAHERPHVEKPKPPGPNPAPSAPAVLAEPPVREEPQAQPTDGELIERLERLAALHGAGELTDAEFAAVKRQLIA